MDCVKAGSKARSPSWAQSCTIPTTVRRYRRVCCSGEASRSSRDSLSRANQAEPDPLLLGHQAVGLDIDRKFVITNHGETLPWDAVVLACGGRARVLTTVEGEGLPVLRTPEDLRALRRAAARHGDVTVVGAGLIGLEIAAGLSRPRRVQSRLYTTRERPMDGIVGPELGQVISDLHSKHGVQLRCRAPSRP